MIELDPTNVLQTSVDIVGIYKFRERKNLFVRFKTKASWHVVDMIRDVEDLL